MGTRDREQPLHAEGQRPFRHPTCPVRDINNLDRKRARPASEVISKSFKTNPTAIRKVSCSSGSWRSVVFVLLSSFSSWRCTITSFPSFSSSIVQTHVNNIKKPAGKLQRDGQGK
jgi:hypothetical protein